LKHNLEVKMKINALLFPLILSLPFTVNAGTPKSESEKFSYAIGFQIGQSLKRDSIEVETESLVSAIKDVINDSKLKMTPEEMEATIKAFQAKAVAKREATGAESKKAGEKFLAENKKKKGVKETKSGLQYKVLKDGSGKKPGEKDTVVVNYRGTLINGTEFDSSYGRGTPATFQVGQVIKGWQEALQLMKTGSKLEVYVPSMLAYGPNGAGGKIGPHETLIFEVELVEIKDEKK